MLGYRKIPEDSVVFPKEEYEYYKKIVDGKAIMVENITDLNRLVQFPIEYDGKMFDAIDDFGNYIDDQARKETAEKWYDKAITMLLALWKAGTITTELYNSIVMSYNELAKQFGIEVEE